MSLELQTDTEVLTSTSANARGDRYGNLCVVPPYNAFPKHEYLTSTGASSGNININSNYTALTEIYHQSTTEFRVYSLAIVISTATKINQNDYGSISGGLVNGFDFYYRPAGGSDQKLSNHTIQTNDDFCLITPDFKITQFEGTAQTINILLNINLLFGSPLILYPNDKFLIKLQDNLSALSQHSFCLNGIIFV